MSIWSLYYDELLSTPTHEEETVWTQGVKMAACIFLLSSVAVCYCLNNQHWTRHMQAGPDNNKLTVHDHRSQVSSVGNKAWSFPAPPECLCVLQTVSSRTSWRGDGLTSSHAYVAGRRSHPYLFGLVDKASDLRSVGLNPIKRLKHFKAAKLTSVDQGRL